MCFPLVVGVLCLSLFCYALLCVLFSFAIIFEEEERAGGCFASLSYGCFVTINDL